MFTRIASSTVKQVTSHALPSLSTAAVVESLSRAPMSIASFSTAVELVPGIGFGKTSTGIVGLPADPDACSKIVTKYQAIIDRMAASDLPATSQYRVDVQKIAQYRIDIATQYAHDPDMVEELCRCGQVEELVEQANDEMIVLDMYLKERLWEEIDDSDIEIEYNPDPSKDGEGLDEEEEK